MSDSSYHVVVVRTCQPMWCNTFKHYYSFSFLSIFYFRHFLLLDLQWPCLCFTL